LGLYAIGLNSRRTLGKPTASEAGRTYLLDDLALLEYFLPKILATPDIISNTRSYTFLSTYFLEDNGLLICFE
jgi:hypothetical protein